MNKDHIQQSVEKLRKSKDDDWFRDEYTRRDMLLDIEHAKAKPLRVKEE